MATANQPLDEWREILEKILQYYADLPYSYGEVNTYLIVSRDRNHFMLVDEGWENNLRVHGCVVHAEIRNDKIGFTMTELKMALRVNLSLLEYLKIALSWLFILPKYENILDMRSPSLCKAIVL